MFELKRIKVCLIRDTLNGERKRFLKFHKIPLTIPVTYKITDYIGEEIQGLFNEKDLKKVPKHISN